MGWSFWQLDAHIAGGPAGADGGFRRAHQAFISWGRGVEDADRGQPGLPGRAGTTTSAAPTTAMRHVRGCGSH